MANRFTLQKGGWYAMTMYPGYSACPYRSPIRIHLFVPMGNRQFDLEYLNAGYAAGVQMMSATFLVIKRATLYLIAEDPEQPDRNYIFEALTKDWFRMFCPGLEIPWNPQLDVNRLCRVLDVGPFNDD